MSSHLEEISHEAWGSLAASRTMEDVNIAAGIAAQRLGGRTRSLYRRVWESFASSRDLGDLSISAGEALQRIERRKRRRHRFVVSIVTAFCVVGLTSVVGNLAGHTPVHSTLEEIGLFGLLDR